MIKTILTSIMMIYSGLVFALLLFSASARQASSFDISPALARQYKCSQSCLDLYNTKTKPTDKANFPDTYSDDFYATASNFSHSQPGDLLKLKVADSSKLNIAPGTTVYRFQYTSIDLDGSNVPATGFIAFPYTFRSWGNPPTQNTFRLAAWAHGTSGLYYGCVPSSSPTLYDTSTWQQLVQEGYAVVGTDYVGIGNNHTSHKFLSFPIQATDVYYSIVAARKAFGHVFSHEWVSIGHSQGGGVVWKLAESKYAQDPDSDYLGTVAIAPATYVVDLMLKNFSTYPRPGISAVLTTSLKRAVPSYEESCLAPIMKARLELEEKAQVCFFAAVGMAADLSLSQIMSAAGLAKDLPLFANWQSKMAPALGAKSPAPILVIQGGNDSFILPYITAKAVDRSCASGNEVTLSVYPEMEHSSVIPASVLEWLPWINQLFDRDQTSEQTKHLCSRVVREPFDKIHLKTPSEVNF